MSADPAAETRAPGERDGAAVPAATDVARAASDARDVGEPGARSATASEPGAEPASPGAVSASSPAAATAAPGSATVSATEASAHGTRLDAWWARVLATPRRRALWYWGGPVLVTLLAAVLRFWNLGHPQQLVFDETYYVKDAWTLWHLGYESTWPDGADERFADGDTDLYTGNPSYVVHPPLGKWLIGLGMGVFGAGDAFWWRASTALAGTIAVFLVTLLARRLTGTTIVGVLAGVLFAIDGNAIVMSRVALLDTWLMLWCLVGVSFVVLDRDRSRSLLEARLSRIRSDGREPYYGPALWARPWVIAAGAAFGAATAVKWSGLYFLAAFGVYLVITDALARRRAGLSLWATGAVLKQAPVTFLLYVPVAAVVYLASWSGWLLTTGGYDRQWAQQGDHAATGLWAWAPHWLQSLWHYHQSAYTFHLGVHGDHPWQANPLTWLLMIRPTNMYYREVEGCSSGCVESIMGIGNPLIWWTAAIAAGYLVYRLTRYREWTAGLVLLGLGAGYLPWLLYLDRTVFQFYSIVFQPYLVLGLALVIALVLGRPTDASWRRQRGIAIVTVFFIWALAVSAWFYPIWSAMPIEPDFRRLHFWLPSWG